MNEMLKDPEAISALADGELHGDAFARAVEHVGGDAQARADWQAYHLVGDVLRSGAQAALPVSSGFAQRLQARLALEAAPSQPKPAPAATPVVSIAPAANEPDFRWKLAAGFATLAAVGAIAWNAAGLSGAPQTGQLAQGVAATQTAQAPASPASQEARPQDYTTVAGNDPQQVMIRDRRLDELLAAHKQFGGTSALQMPAGFLRNATFEAPSR